MKKGFTLGELTVTLIIITMVVIVTLPITFSKMKKVEGYAYYMGYSTAVNIWANISIDDLSVSVSDSDLTYEYNSPGIFSLNKIAANSLTYKYYLADLSNVPFVDYFCDYYGDPDCEGNKTAEIAPVDGSGGGDDDDDPEISFGPVLSLPVDDTREESEEDVTVEPTKNSFCVAIKDKYNTSSTNCSAAAITSSNITDFKDKTPHVVLSNGLRLYISDYGTISDLSDSTDEGDGTGFVLYIDVNGSDGDSVLWSDVFPFYLTTSGKVIPAYNNETDNYAGAANKEHLRMNVIYDAYSSSAREVKLLIKDSNFKRAACATGYVTSSKYCSEYSQYDLCKTEYHDCRFIVNKPLKFL